MIKGLKTLEEILSEEGLCWEDVQDAFISEAIRVERFIFDQKRPNEIYFSE